jgi:hypothetical protein
VRLVTSHTKGGSCRSSFPLRANPKPLERLRHSLTWRFVLICPPRLARFAWLANPPTARPLHSLARLVRVGAGLSCLRVPSASVVGVRVALLGVPNGNYAPSEHLGPPSPLLCSVLTQRKRGRSAFSRPRPPRPNYKLS